MIADLECVVLDCPDPLRLAEFYQLILGGIVNEHDARWATGDGWATLHAPSGMVFAFQRVGDYQPPQWPDAAHPQQFHLDFAVVDLDRAQEEALTWGATLLDHGGGQGWRILADPAGHPFCLVRRRVGTVA